VGTFLNQQLTSCMHVIAPYVLHVPPISYTMTSASRTPFGAWPPSTTGSHSHLAKKPTLGACVDTSGAHSAVQGDLPCPDRAALYAAFARSVQIRPSSAADRSYDDEKGAGREEGCLFLFLSFLFFIFFPTFSSSYPSTSNTNFITFSEQLRKCPHCATSSAYLTYF
jgi:hypothetical protein